MQVYPLANSVEARRLLTCVHATKRFEQFELVQPLLHVVIAPTVGGTRIQAPCGRPNEAAPKPTQEKRTPLPRSVIAEGMPVDRP